MTALRLALSELRRLTAGRMPRLAVLAVVLIPTLYASLYLWANHDPYGKLATVPAALVVEDVPAESEQSGSIHAGRDVARDLVEDGSFDWQEVSADEAASGVKDGTYLFALTIPRGFSAALASTADFDPQKGTLVLTTNEANNYLSSTIAEQVLTRVSSSIAENVSERAASSFLLGFSTLHDQLKKAGAGADDLADGLVDADDGARQLASGAARLVDGQTQLLDGQRTLNAGLVDAESGANRLASGAADLADGAGRAKRGANQVSSGAGDLADGAGRLKDGADQVAGGTADLAKVADEIAEASQNANDDLDDIRADIANRLAAAGLTPEQQQEILDSLDELRDPLDQVNDRVQSTSGQIDQLADGAAQVADGAGDLKTGATKLAAGAGRVADGAGQLSSGATTLSKGAADLDDGLGTARAGSSDLVDGQRDAKDGADRLASGSSTLAAGLGDAREGARTLADGLADGIRSIPDLSEDRRDETADAIASPIRTQDVAQASADSYGAGLAPFFLAIGAWVGGYVMFLLVRPLSNRAIAARQSPWRTALGGWLTPALLAGAQVSIMLAVVMSVVGIDVLHATQVAVFLLLVAAAFVAIVHTLNAWLGPVGQLLGLVLLVMQLASAGGTFPWQTLPPTLQAIHHVLPMTYAIDGIRHLMYGASLESLPTDIAVLLAYVVGGIALSAAAAYRRRIWRVSQIKPEIAL